MLVVLVCAAAFIWHEASAPSKDTAQTEDQQTVLADTPIAVPPDVLVTMPTPGGWRYHVGLRHDGY